ncbi:MAG: carbohydrate binding domain-containing protein [Acidobacteriota bacterium]
MRVAVVAVASILLVPLCSAATENLVQNGGFEQLDASGWAVGWRRGVGSRIDTRGYDGRYCLRLDGCATAAGCTQGVRLKPGKRYDIRFVMRTRSVRDGSFVRASASVALGFIGPSGGEIGRFGPEALSGTTDWTPIRIISPAVPADLKAASLEVRFTTAATSGTAWFDNLSVNEYTPDPLETFLLYPNYRGLLGERTWEPTGIGMQCEVHTPGIPLSELSVLAQIRDSQGNVLWNDGPAGAPARSFTRSFDLRWILRGHYDFLAALMGKSGRTLHVSSFPVEVSHVVDLFARPVFVRADNTVLVAGKAFFPLGVEDSVDPDDQALVERRARLLDGSPFNLMYNNEMLVGHPEQVTATLRKFADRGVMTAIPVGRYPGVRGDSPGDILEHFRGNSPEARISDCVQSLRNETGLLCWVLGEDFAPQFEPFVEARYARLMRLDPGHPTCLFQPGEDVEQVTKFGRATDVFGAVAGPRSTSSVARVGVSTDAVKSALHGCRPVWVSIRPYQEEPDYRPTRTELRAMTYLALARGARGILYGSLPALLRGGSGGEQWRVLASVAAEVRALEGLLLNGGRVPTPPITPAFLAGDSRALILADRKVLIVVNSRSRACDATLLLPTSAREVAVLFEDRILPVSNQSVHDRFEPLETHVYEY